jgi:hypothetical protein
MFTDVIQSQRLYLQCIIKKKEKRKVPVVDLELSLKKLENFKNNNQHK